MPTAATRARTNKPKPDPAEVIETPAPKKETVQQLKNRLRNEAEREVLNNHKGEVIKITEAKYDQHGLEYVRRLTDEEKAAKQIEELYAQFPHLRPQLEQQQAQLVDDTVPPVITYEEDGVAEGPQEDWAPSYSNYEPVDRDSYGMGDDEK